MGDKNKNTTTMDRVLEKPVHEIAIKFIHRYGPLKRVLSAGILALDKLSAEQREEIFEEVNKPQPDFSCVRQSVNTIITTFGPDSIGQRKIPSQEEQLALNELIKAIGPDMSKIKSKKKAE